jgi:hypothetical protein
MTEHQEMTIEERLSRLERRVDALVEAFPGRARDSSGANPRARASQRGGVFSNSSYRSALSSRSIEWWLARGGAILTSLALVLLYQYAVERNWITPVVRVATGVLIGAVLLYSGSRIARPGTDRSDDSVGLREVLFGAGLAAWYITAYAAAIFYGLIPVSAARFVFFALSIAGAWLALSEHRSVLGLLTLGVGFMTPMLLASPRMFVPALAIYLGAITAVGLVLYLMRGWQSVLWLTAVGFWWNAGNAIERLAAGSGFMRIDGSIVTARIAMTLLVVAAGAALVRTPILRRRLVETRSPLYTEPRRSALSRSIQERLAEIVEDFSGIPASGDSAALWIVTIASPLLLLLFTSWIWTSVEGSLWGVASLSLALAAYRLAASAADEEFKHVEATATALLSLAGIAWLADSVGRSVGQSSAFVIAGAALHALATLHYLERSRFEAPRKIAITTIAFCSITVIISETLFRNFALHGFDTAWTLAELIVIAAAGYVWWTRRDTNAGSTLPTVFGVSSYISLMLVDARILGLIWPPLITASFALGGTGLLIAARGRPRPRVMRQLGGFTLIVVFIRLFMIDLARVETIWRVVLFLGCGALFLFTSHRLQERPADGPPEPVHDS